MPTLITLNDVRKTYDRERYVLDGVNLTLEEGEIITIIGVSGCGKSTLLNIIGLLDSFTSGEYWFAGRQIKRSRLNSYHKNRAQDIGFVFQSYCLIDVLNVQDNILMPYLYANHPINARVMRRLGTILEDFNLATLRKARAGDLSGGERQRVAIARAMIKLPRIIIADEPTGNLDDANAKVVIEAFKTAAASGTAVIVVTHNSRLSFGAHKSYSLKEGRLCLC
jgi:ABC-type lipoprotein export system ATPase subunit